MNITSSTSYEATEYGRWVKLFDSSIITKAIGIGAPIIIAIGIPANLATIVVFSKLKKGIGQSVRVYYLGIAVSELIMILWLTFITFFLSFLSFYGVPSIMLLYLGEWPCIFGRFPYWAFGSVTSFLYVALALERLIAISFPLRARNILTHKTASYVVTGIYLFWIGFWIIIFGFASRYVQADSGGIDCSPGYFSTAIRSAYLTLYVALDYLGPTILSTVLSCMLLYQTLRVARQRRHMMGGAQKEDAGSDVAAELRRNAVALITISINIVYYWPLSVTLPMAFSSFDPLILAVNQILHGLSGAIYCMNFFIYIIKIKEFRRALFKCQA